MDRAMMHRLLYICSFKVVKGKMAATMLYSAMLDGERPKFKKYLGRISAANAPSINLHFLLGGRIVSVYDEYIYRASRKKTNL